MSQSATAPTTASLTTADNFFLEAMKPAFREDPYPFYERFRETAPLLLTTFFTTSINFNPFKGPQAALPTLIWDQFNTGTPTATDRAWGAALVLIVLVMILYLGAKIIACFTGVKRV